MTRVTNPHDDALVVMTEVKGFDMKMIVVNGDTSADIIFLKI